MKKMKKMKKKKIKLKKKKKMKKMKKKNEKNYIFFFKKNEKKGGPRLLVFKYFSNFGDGSVDQEIHPSWPTSIGSVKVNPHDERLVHIIMSISR